MRQLEVEFLAELMGFCQLLLELTNLLFQLRVLFHQLVGSFLAERILPHQVQLVPVAGLNDAVHLLELDLVLRPSVSIFSYLPVEIDNLLGLRVLSCLQELLVCSQVIVVLTDLEL